MDGIVLFAILAGMAMTLSGCGSKDCIVPIITGAEIQLDDVSGDCCAAFKTVGGIAKKRADQFADKAAHSGRVPGDGELKRWNQHKMCPAFVNLCCSCRDSSNPLIKKASAAIGHDLEDKLEDKCSKQKDAMVEKCEENPNSPEHFESLQHIFAETTYAAANVQNAEVNTHGTAAYALVAAFGGAMSGALVLYSARRFSAGQVSQPPLLGQ